ncbi:hypothetical protein FRX31_022042 [Thalictrum thalictroides]|uniref:Uncharacterized protein n=1 Tax=Thalictrum thalictroides TaxID=46969 RepID=A0A7J6VW25_THATH|nr:hypothetical protein FRX31_022042 [Thalictrum thalictroides]
MHKHNIVKSISSCSPNVAVGSNGRPLGILVATSNSIDAQQQQPTVREGELCHSEIHVPQTQTG